MRIDRSYIYVDRLQVAAAHGVMAQERSVGGLFEVSLRVGVDMSAAMQTDSVGDTVSYADLCDVVAHEMRQPSHLLEHVAGRVARAIAERFPQVQSIDLDVKKLCPPMNAECSGAGVEIHLTKDETS